MTIKNIDPKGDTSKPNSDDEMKPLVREYAKKHPSVYKESHRIISGRISASGSWCLLETENYVVLMKSNSSTVEELFENILPNLHNKRANELVAVPQKKAKTGAIIGVDDESQCWYSYDAERKTFQTSDTKISEEGEKKQSSLNLSMFLDTKPGTESQGEEPPEELSTTTSRRVRKPKD